MSHQRPVPTAELLLGEVNSGILQDLGPFVHGRATHLLLTWSTLFNVHPLPAESNCSCSITNSRCDEFGICRWEASADLLHQGLMCPMFNTLLLCPYCRCDPGWDGELCERCVPKPGCLHGSCQQPWQCSCDTGWGGRFCDKGVSPLWQDFNLKGLFPFCVSKLWFWCGRPAGVCRAAAVSAWSNLCGGGQRWIHLSVSWGFPWQELSAQGWTLSPDEVRTLLHARPLALVERFKNSLSVSPPVSRSPCKNSGLCEDADGFAAELTCRCLAGFTGSRCETNVDDCLMKPCANGATCLDGINRFSCLCPHGFTGRFCTVNVDDCASRPCLNTGRCLDRPGAFHCVCRRGFIGTTCETPLQDGPYNLSTKGKPPTTVSNSSIRGEQLFKVTVSERGSTWLSRPQLIVLLVLAALTLGAVVLTASFVLQSHCSNCDRVSFLSPSQRVQKSSQRTHQDTCQIHFLNTAEAEKKKLNTEVMLTEQQQISAGGTTSVSSASVKALTRENTLR